MAVIYQIVFPPPADLLNMNRRGSHWSDNHRAKVEWRNTAQIVSRDMVNRKLIPEHLPFSMIQFAFPVKSLKIRRDPHNFYPTVKAIIDGLVLAKVFQDDSSRHLATTEPTFHVDPPTVIITITTKGTS